MTTKAIIEDLTIQIEDLNETKKGLDLSIREAQDDFLQVQQQLNTKDYENHSHLESLEEQEEYLENEINQNRHEVDQILREISDTTYTLNNLKRIAR